METPLTAMSLKRYVFFIIALFVIVLAGAQLLFASYIQQQISKEVEAKTRTLSEQALNILVNNVDISPGKEFVRQAQAGIVVSVRNTPNKVIKLNDSQEFISGDQTQTVTIQSLPKVSTAPQIRALRGNMDDLKIHRFNQSYAFTVNADGEGIKHQQIVQFERKGSAIQQYFNWLSVATIITCLLGLLLAYWLAKHISHPLQSLSKGFVALEKGQMGTQVPAEGVQEVRETLKRFNHMSARLVELNEMEARYQQRHQLAELGEVTRGLAHTLRNPINTIGLAIEQISQENVDLPQRQELAQQARQKINHLDNTIKALLSLTAGGVNRRDSLDVNSIVQDIIMELGMMGHHQIAFSPAQKVTLTGSESEVRAMIHTLLVNAVEASENEEQVSVFTEMSANCVVVTVIDQGKGISAAIRDNLFKPHVSDKPEGAGMGLYIAKRISQSHYAGDISLKEHSPKGSIARLTLCPLHSEGTNNEQ